ncbi:MAG: hypothetical protein M3Y55_07960, partial [Pseudomonadota bacterium]|nr:hypothetical protein [Pseudomonadota bacterium]
AVRPYVRRSPRSEGVLLVLSSGQVDGHNNRLKSLKRQMYGRPKLALLRVRVRATSELEQGASHEDTKCGRPTVAFLYGKQAARSDTDELVGVRP